MSMILVNILLMLVGVLSLAMSVLGFQCYNAQDRSKVKMKWNYSIVMIVLSSLLILGPSIALAVSSGSTGIPSSS